jgi:predicted DCC family thiol-disulfide oxidoreductase YuxK
VSKTRVYYNSACPVCNAGIGAERRRMAACNIAVEWIDIHRDPQRLEEIGASQEFVRKRLHVVDDTGTVRVGAEAFGALWSQTPQLRRLAALLRMPVIRTIVNSAYNLFAAGLYRWNRWRGRW